MTKAPPEPAEQIENDPRWTRVAARDESADGQFVYAVGTTGIYCRPSCPSRRPKPENVSFWATPAKAEAAGFRPCRRCDPDGQAPAEALAAMIVKACRLIENAEGTPTLATLAAACGLSPHHFHRRFKAATGLTPRAYHAARRSERIRESLTVPSAPITGAVYEAGFGSASRFYERSRDVLGMTPKIYRQGAPGEDIRFATGQCALGAILVAATDKGICAILLGDEPNALAQDLRNRFPKANLIGGDENFGRMVARVVGFVDAPATGLGLPLDIRGTAFQQRVWQALLDIPAGRTATYTDIAGRIGAPKSVRAVATACAANRIAVLIPCHRAVRTGGALAGYRWGIERKRALLDREAEAAGRERLDAPTEGEKPKKDSD